MSTRCALSGKMMPDDAPFFKDDGLGDTPPGWITVKFERRIYNPDYLSIIESKRALLQAQLGSLPQGLAPDVMAATTMAFTRALDAQFHALESDTPLYLTFKQEVVIAPPEMDAGLLEAVQDVMDRLGMPPLAESDIGFAVEPPEGDA